MPRRRGKKFQISDLGLEKRQEQMRIPHPEKRVRDDRFAVFRRNLEGTNGRARIRPFGGEARIGVAGSASRSRLGPSRSLLVVARIRSAAPPGRLLRAERRTVRSGRTRPAGARNEPYSALRSVDARRLRRSILPGPAPRGSPARVALPTSDSRSALELD